MVGCYVSFFVSLIEDLRFGCAPVGVCFALQVSTGWKGFVCVCEENCSCCFKGDRQSYREKKKGS